MLTINEASRLLNINPSYAKGVLEGFGVELMRVGNAFLFDEHAFKRLTKHVEKSRKGKATQNATA